jgi:hypothetical protein
MEPDNPANTSQLRATHSSTLWAALSSNMGAMFKAVLYSEVFWRETIEEPAPEPSRVEWEDTQ